MTGKLTTHVLDTTCGFPAVGVTIELWWINCPSEERTLLKTTTTNSDGRTDTPLLADDELQSGIYEMVFVIGDYFSQCFSNLPQPMFLDRIPIQFGIADPAMHYHIPLLVSPYFYSTYRGS